MALEQACLEGRAADVQRLLAGGQAARADEDLGLALALASSAGHLDVVELLLANGAGADGAIFSTGRSHRTADCSIVAACSAGHLAVVDRLLAAIATPSAMPGRGFKYSQVYLCDALDRAICAGHIEVLERLVAVGVRVSFTNITIAARTHPRNMRLLALLVGWRLSTSESVDGGSHSTADHLQRDRDVALVCASHRGDLDAVDAALAAGADPNVDKGIAVTLACAGGHACAGTALRLIAAGANATTAQHVLEEACGHGNVDVVTALLRAGADPAQDHWALQSACYNGHTAIVELLLDAGSGADCITQALPCACAKGDHAIVRLLLAAGADARHDTPSRALAAACGSGQLALCVELLAAGAEINVPTELEERPAAGASPFYSACTGNHLDVARLLLAHGADIHTLDDAGLEIACFYGFIDLVDWLITAGANVHAGSGAALRAACRSGRLAVVDMLIQSGANVNACGMGYTQRAPIRGPQTALTAAADNGRAPVVGRLLAAGADVHAVDDAALRLACREGHSEVVHMLIRAGANVHALDDEAVREASRHGFVRIVERLLHAGADATQVQWVALHPELDWPECVMRIRSRAHFRGLPEAVQVLWLRRRLRIERCLDRLLQRVRDRLDRPPPPLRTSDSEPAALGVGAPTRDELIAHLRRGGRRFARDYWTEGAPLFFPALAATLGPVPDEFQVEVRSGGGGQGRFDQALE